MAKAWQRALDQDEVKCLQCLMGNRKGFRLYPGITVEEWPDLIYNLKRSLWRMNCWHPGLLMNGRTTVMVWINVPPDGLCGKGRISSLWLCQRWSDLEGVGPSVSCPLLSSHDGGSYAKLFCSPQCGFRAPGSISHEPGLLKPQVR